MSIPGQEHKYGVKQLRNSGKALLLLLDKGQVPDIRQIKIAFGVSHSTACRYRPVLADMFEELMDVIDKRVEAELVEMVHDKHIKAERQRKAEKQVSIKFEDTPEGQGLAS